MINKELINWFNEYFDNCYNVKHDDYPWSIFMYYDKNFVRQQKLAKLDGKNIIKHDITGVFLFEQNWENNTLRCNYNLIWSYFTKYNILIYDDIQSTINFIIKDRPIINNLTPDFIFYFQQPNEYHKMTIIK